MNWGQLGNLSPRTEAEMEARIFSWAQPVNVHCFKSLSYLNG
jgi:hypothetical protein